MIQMHQATMNAAAAAKGAESMAKNLETAARELLRQSNYLAVRQVTCIERGGALLLEGEVPSFYLKQLAQSILLNGFRDNTVINNQLVVSRA